MTPGMTSKDGTQQVLALLDLIQNVELYKKRMLALEKKELKQQATLKTLIEIQRIPAVLKDLKEQKEKSAEVLATAHNKAAELISNAQAAIDKDKKSAQELMRRGNELHKACAARKDLLDKQEYNLSQVNKDNLRVAAELLSREGVLVNKSNQLIEREAAHKVRVDSLQKAMSVNT